ncbi:hypothetical protein [Streptomyces sp. PTY087I2]|uniref:hypothetical protein n=1 Tax=Streptomyces sp. PTY087I2 TaxID=1819298 RepID=UPI001C400609|nr:hypothetical protein [Streptomyces sp. PTY087I2]
MEAFLSLDVTRPLYGPPSRKLSILPHAGFCASLGLASTAEALTVSATVQAVMVAAVAILNRIRLSSF